MARVFLKTVCCLAALLRRMLGGVERLRPATVIFLVRQVLNPSPISASSVSLRTSEPTDGKSGTPGNEECLTYRAQAWLKGSNPTLTAKLLLSL